MCGIAGILDLRRQSIPELSNKLEVMNTLLEHRGPDDAGIWISKNSDVGLAHRRLSIIDLSDAGKQPMIGENGTVITLNGEIYNFLELRDSLKDAWRFQSHSDTETVLAAYERYGEECLTRLRGMFAFGLYDSQKRRLFCARDRFGIKPFYYAMVKDTFIFASEVKALLPFLPVIETDPVALSEYLTFQYTIGENTLFKGVKQLLPGHALSIEDGNIRVYRYWDVHYKIDFDHSPRYFEERLTELLNDSLAVHLRSDVPVASYLSGGIDSSIIALLASEQTNLYGSFHGKFTQFPGYDESPYAEMVAKKINHPLYTIDITAQDFLDYFGKVIYHLDYPVAGPGSFPQFMVSKLASEHVKVILGGQGGDELFGGYARYVLAYFEQCIKAAIDGSYQNGHFVVTPESIIPNLGVLQEYTPMMREFWREGLFGPLDERYFRLCDRSVDLQNEINASSLDRKSVLEKFKRIFNNAANVGKEAYFDKMTHFDFKCLLPALLQVEDRMSMAHGIESRVPLLDHPLVEFAATIPADIKFKDGRMKHVLKNTFAKVLPSKLLTRRDKMGFPVPLKEWFGDELKEMIHDILGSDSARTRPFINQENWGLGTESTRFSRKTWGLLSLEVWHQSFHDKAAYFKKKLETRMEVIY